MSVETLVYVEVGKTVEQNGYVFTAKPAEEVSETEPTRLSEHESLHAVTGELNGTSAEETSIIAESNSLGHTTFRDGDATAASAPHAFGYEGTGWDVSLVGWMGQTLGAAMARARSLISGNWDLVRGVAAELQDKKILFGSQIRETMRRVLRNRVEAQVFMRSPEGEDRHFIAKLDRDRNLVPIPLTPSPISLN